MSSELLRKYANLVEAAIDADDGYESVASWKDGPLVHKRWTKDYQEGNPVDRHMSSIEMWQEYNKLPATFNASHSIQKGWLNDTSAKGPPVKVTHKSQHTSLNDAKAALAKHTSELYRKS